MKWSRNKRSWYKSKGYLHFDYAQSKDKIFEYVSDSLKISCHSFSPFIHYTKKSRRYKRNKITKKLVIELKTRHICYASHIDSYIYGYYNKQLGDKYKDFLRKKGIEDCVLAYRQIQKKGIKFCNIHMAEEAFDYVKSTDGCNVICLDIKDFFDSLCPITLKKHWCEVIGEEKLPDDHFNIYRNLVNFTYVEEEDCIKYFGIHPRKHKKGKEYNLSHRLCSYRELRKVNKDNGIIKDKFSLGVKGIPQGSPMSGLMANIFMIHFDERMKNYAIQLSGFYRRYSDDIFFAFPKNQDFVKIVADIQTILKETTNSSLNLNPKKTEERIYEPNGHPQDIQYLGFVFNGKKIYIRNSSISKNRAQIAKTVRKNKKGKCKINTRAVYKKQSTLVLTPFDKKERGFINYASRSITVMGKEGIAKQVAKNDAFIKQKIHDERPKKR